MQNNEFSALIHSLAVFLGVIPSVESQQSPWLTAVSPQLLRKPNETRAKLVIEFFFSLMGIGHQRLLDERIKF